MKITHEHHNEEWRLDVDYSEKLRLDLFPIDKYKAGFNLQCTTLGTCPVINACVFIPDEPIHLYVCDDKRDVIYISCDRIGARHIEAEIDGRIRKLDLLWSNMSYWKYSWKCEGKE